MSIHTDIAEELAQWFMDHGIEQEVAMISMSLLTASIIAMRAKDQASVEMAQRAED